MAPMIAIHERMLVVIPPKSFGVWLNPAEHDVGRLARLLQPFRPDNMTAYPVSTLVNTVQTAAVKCVEPLKAG